ncbi:siphovirus Gp157 family protein [uncultured Alsobacter sp.]|uniref:siphovirus Gp157 family protein n=1 Tax=uncultured Alsobacter sp. TaxID=1748258 RepID=UPI0025D16F61|nr:siphovirus Gp157 family protein [uncultured Alsobacter sp.]
MSKAKKATYSVVRDAERELQALTVLRAQIAEMADGDEDTIRDTLEGEADFDTLFNRLLEEEAQDQALMKGLKLHIDTLSDRKSRFEKRINTLRDLLANAMDIAGLKKWEGPVATISLSEKAASITVTEEADVPTAYWKQPDPVVDKRALNTAVMAREAERAAAIEEARKIEDEEERQHRLDAIETELPPIPGVVIGNGGWSVTIRRG